MRIAVSLLNYRPGQIGGAETYLRQLLAHLPGEAEEDHITLVAAADIAAQVRTPGLHLAVVDQGDARLVGQRVAEAFSPWRARAVERLFAALAPDVALFPQQSIFPKTLACPCVLTVHDVQHLFYPQNFGLFDRLYRAALYPWSLRRARHIIAISQFTRRTLIERCGVAAEKITAVPLGMMVSTPAGIEPQADVPSPYLYYPAATLAHKGHDTLLRTCAALRRRGRFPYKLVFSGRQTRRWPRLRRLIAELGLADDVRHLGFVPFAEVQRLYAGADAVVFPTQFEGFGLPVTEAVAFGKKIIASRLEVFDEIGLPRRFQIDFAQPEQLLAALALPGPTVLEKPLQTWSDTARQTLAVLRAMAREERPTFDET